METQDNVQNGLPALAKESVAPSVETITRDNAGDLSPIGIRSSPPAIPEKALMTVVDASHRSPEEKATKSDSEAETIVLPGKNGYSPSKTKKAIKHEDQSEEGEIREEYEDVAELEGQPVPSSNINSSLGKRKRARQGKNKDDQKLLGNSSGLSSVPTSPVVSRSKPSKNESDHSRSPSPRTIPHKANSVDRLTSRNEATSSADEGEPRNHKRQHSVGGSEASSHRKHENLRASKSQPHSGEKSRKHSRSESPPVRTHRRISSAQATSSAINGLSHKKKRVPAPLLATRDRQSTEYHSDESSASGSPHPRSSRLRKLTTPATAESTLSAIIPSGKMGKKGRDGIGRTPLARACASDEGYNTVKQILENSHEDLNAADNAGNTPLQIACLGGYADIVKLLIEQGCEIHCMNMDRDTPLLDAVENGHLDVVKLLIDAGVNPRRGNLEGEEPLDRLAPDMDNSEEIRELLLAARLKCADRKPSADHSMHDVDDRSSRGTSPRPSPPMQQPEDLYTGRRRRPNGRSQKTNEKLLWQSMDTTTLRDAAGKGDTETVNRILQVRDNMADTESLVRAARGGHEDVMQLLLAIGGANADPPPLPSKSSAPEYATPMLAAIGREKIEVVKLLLDQPNFDPTKKIQGETYFEIAKRREGPRWREEEGLLREAYNRYAGENKEFSNRPRSPEARRDSDRNGKRARERIDATSPIRKPKVSSFEALHNDGEMKAKASATNDSAKRDVKKSSPSTDNQSKVGPGAKKSFKTKKDEHFQSPHLSERESGQSRPKLMKKISEPETANPNSDNDLVKPRRKLMSGKELKGEKEKQRRESVASTASNSQMKERVGSRINDLNKVEPSKLINTTNHTELDSSLDKIAAMDRPRALKRDDSKDRLGAIRGDSPSKRPRESPTPPRAGSHDSARTADDNGLPIKKRRLDSEGHASSSPDNRTISSLASSENNRAKPNMLLKERHRQTSLASQGHGKMSDGHSEAKKPPNQNKRPTNISNNPDSNRHGDKVPSSGAPLRVPREATETKDDGKVAEQKAIEEREAKLKAEREEQARQEAEKLDAERRRLEAEKAEAEERARREAQEKLEEERLKQERAEEERQAAENRVRELQEEQAREHEAKLRHLQKLKQEETERKERLAREEAEARHRAEEERRRIYLEQEQKKKEEAERKRAAREAEVRAERERERERHEAERRAKLPQLLRSFETYPTPQTPEFASLFKDIIGVRYDTLGHEHDSTGPEAKELWILNTQVAFLLGFKDLQLSRYTAWERIPASKAAKIAIYNTEGDRYACTAPALRPLNPEGRTNISRTIELRNINLQLFMNLDLFFVKLSEFMYIVPNFRHLHDIKMSVSYRELPKEDGSKWNKWKEELGAGPFCPQPTYYINGQLVGEDRIQYAQGRSTPFPRPVPSAPRDPDNMIARLSVSSPRYAEACRAQGLWHLLPEEERDALLSSRGGDGRVFTGNGNAVTMNGFTPSPSAPSEIANEKFQPHQGGEDTYGSPPLVNGINGGHGRH